jgi:colanic acid biosynthesis protein WcaH
MKEYAEEKGTVNKSSLITQGQMPLEEFQKAHQYLPLVCHDIMLEYQGGILLVTRNNPPGNGFLWPIGGRVQKGKSIEESLQEKVKAESNLEIEDLVEIGHARTYFRTDPFSHGKGTDTFNFMFLGKGKGELSLDSLHSDPMIVKKKTYTKEFKREIHSYVRYFMNIALPRVKELNKLSL